VFSRSRLQVGLAICLSSSIACEAKAELDASVDEVVASLGSCDKTRLAAAVEGGLTQELEEKFEPMCETVAWFGPVKKRSQTSIHVSDSGNKGEYDFEFDKGHLTLKIAIQNDHVAGFQFTGDDWLKAKGELEKAKYPEFKVYNFEFVDASGKVVDGKAYPAGKIKYRVKIGGMAPKDGRFQLSSQTRILDAKGAVMWAAPKPTPIVFPADDNSIGRSGTVDATITIPVAGPHQLEFAIVDTPSGATTKYVHQVTTVGGAAPAAPAPAAPAPSAPGG
jgi:hypothetical protein